MRRCLLSFWSRGPSPATLVLLGLACGGEDGLPSGHWSVHGPVATSGSGAGSNGSAAGAGALGGGTTASNGSAGSGSSTGSTSGSGGGATSSSGGGSPPPSSSPSPPKLGVSIDQPALSMQLLAQSTVHVTIAPNGYMGGVQLALGQMPPGVAGTFSPATLSLDGFTTGTSTLALKTADSTPPGSVSVDVVTTAAGVTTHATVALTVEPKITLHVPQGVNDLGGTVGNPVTTAYGPYPVKITAPQGISGQNPVTVYFYNDDDIPHEIHADDDAQGFAHDPGPFDGHSMDPYVRQVSSTGAFQFYLHDQGAPITVGLIEIQ